MTTYPIQTGFYSPDLISSSAALEETTQPKQLSARKRAAVCSIVKEFPKTSRNEWQEIAENEVRALKKRKLHAFEIGGQEYAISKIVNNSQRTLAIAVAKVDTNQLLGEGSIGKVYAMDSTLVGIDEVEEMEIIAPRLVMKQPELEFATKEMQNDAYITALLNEDGPKRGIPLPSHFIEYPDRTPRLILPQLEYDGNELAARKKKDGTILQLSQSMVQSLLADVWEGLEHIHKKGVNHRDIKPGNLMMGANAEGEEEMKFIDFDFSIQLDTYFNGIERLDEIFDGTFSYNVHICDISYMTLFYESADVKEQMLRVYKKFGEKYQSNCSVEQKRKILNEVKAEMRELMNQNDRYATALSLYEILTGEEPDKADSTQKVLYTSPENDKHSLIIVDRDAAREKLVQKLLQSGLLAEASQIMKIVDAIVPLLDKQIHVKSEL